MVNFELLIALPKRILFIIEPQGLQCHDNLETTDTVYPGRSRMDGPATTGSYSLSPGGKQNPAATGWQPDGSDDFWNPSQFSGLFSRAALPLGWTL
jgi:hypothetical protein